MGDNSLTVAIIVIILVCVMYYLHAKSQENFRIKARAYHSCPPSTCSTRYVTADQMLIRNPYLWPYSGSENPAEVITTRPPGEVLKSETDHDFMTS